MTEKRCVVLFTKYPEKGAVKSRLSRYYGEDFVVDLSRTFIMDTLDTLSKGHYSCRVAFYPGDRKLEMINEFGSKHLYMPQTGTDLGERMKNTMTDLFSDGFQFILVIGGDIPDLPNHILESAFRALENHDAVIGPSVDGGYYLIGMQETKFLPDVFEGLKWGTNTVFQDTTKKFKEKGYSLHILPTWRDVDRPLDLNDFMRRNENTEFAHSNTMTFLRTAMSCQFSIIIPVLNESSLINDTIEHVRSISGIHHGEIIVIDGNPGGNTIGKIQSKKVVKLISKQGRGNQMNAGADVARGNILIFLHADTRLPRQSLEHILSVMNNDSYIGGAFDLGIDSDRFILRLIERAASLRSRITKIPYGDQVIFMRKDYFKDLGGYKSIPIMEDVDLMKRVKKRKDRICIIRDRVLTSSRRWEEEGVIYGTLRNWSLITLYFFGVPPARLVKYYQWKKS
jgi:rSAM/selenodomain-associated transferase 2/rSAM/selenodomain-associated transferase 1